MHDRQGGIDEEENPLDAIDFDKIIRVFKKGIPWTLVVIVLSMAGAFAYIRYTKPIYKSESILKLDIKSDAGLLGLQSPLDQDIKGLSGEIEILRSRLFLSQVVDALNLDVSYFHPGRSHLVDERYKNSPFKVELEFAHASVLDNSIEVDFLSDEDFSISIPGMKTEKFRFGDKIKNRWVEMTISKTDHFEEQKNLVDFYFVINSKNALIDYLQSNVTVEPVNLNANTIRISLSDPNQYKARDLVDAIDTIYLAYTKNAKNLAGEQKIKFLENQMVKTSERLEDYEDYFENFTIEHRTTDLSKDLANTIQLLNALDSQRFNVRNQILAVELLYDQVSSYQSITFLKIPPSFSGVVSRYNNLILEKELKSANYNENTQIMKIMNQKIELSRSESLKALDSYKTNLEKKKNELRNRRVILEGNFSQLPSMGTSYNKNRRLYSLQEEFYFSLIKRKMELEIARAGTVTNFVILSPASFPIDPEHPKKLLIYGIAVVVGIVLSVVILALNYLLHDKISNQKELERLTTAPVLGVVPKYMRQKLKITRLVVNNNPKSSISESLRAIRTNMDFIAADVDRKLISITSTVSGEGKTFVAVNLGAICAYSGQKVVIVDLDMRKPKVHMAFEDEVSDKGMSTVLIGRHNYKECIKNSEVENLSYIQAGPTPPNPSELILSSHFDELMDALRKDFDLVILDTPPVGLVTDGILVMKKSDLPIYVVRADYSRKNYAKSIQRLISNNQFDHLSIILNSVRPTGQYSYGYGYSYGNHSSYYEEGKKPSRLKRLLKIN